ncbi:bacterial transcriptional activator domain-containing protein [Kitasatospora sp. NPDC057223]|uniref:bacterial transcriptional activator domain-containing protein n=1 Tax=Kitasatospora sp. NPDC057223 TaxID=3346055 RepID=UPI00363435C4
MEAGTALWADHIEVITSGFGLELQQLLPQCRVMFVPHLAGATADLARVLIEVHQAQHEGGIEPLPWMVVCAGTPSPEELYEFADVLGKVPAGQRIAAVIPAAGPARALFPDAQVLDASLVTQAQPLEVLDGEVVLQRVTDEAYRQLTATLTIAVQPPVPAEGVWGQVPDPDAPQFGPSALHRPGPPAHLSLLPSPAGAPEPTTGAETEPTSNPAPDPASPPATAPDSLPVPAQNAPDAGAPGDASQPVAPVRVKERPRVSIVREGDIPTGPAAPQVQVLGPLRITGIDDAPIQPRLVLLAALLVFKSDRDYGAIANHMDPVNPWTPSTMDTHMSRLRRRLGVDSTGVPYLRTKPKGVEQYSISDEITCDYANFEHLAERGLPREAAGVLDLEAALRLVRGRPFGGAGAHTWAAPLVQTMKTKIVKVAHSVAYQRIQDEVLDIDAARHAISVGLDVEPAAEILFRDWMRIEVRAGNHTGLQEVIKQVRQMVVDMDFDHVDDKTEALIQKLTATSAAANRR